MKYHEKTLAAVLAACVLLSACSSSGSDAVTPEDTPTIENVTTGSTAEPTTSPSEPGGTLQLDEINDDDLIAAALAAYQAAPQPEGTIAWDVLNTSVFENQVSFTMCTWDGLTANDATRDVKYITTITDGGTIEASNVQSSPTSGDCLNTQLIESAIATANFQEEILGVRGAGTGHLRRQRRPRPTVHRLRLRKLPDTGKPMARGRRDRPGHPKRVDSRGPCGAFGLAPVQRRQEPKRARTRVMHADGPDVWPLSRGPPPR